MSIESPWHALHGKRKVEKYKSICKRIAEEI